MVAESVIAGGAVVAGNVLGNAVYDALTEDSKESNELLREILKAVRRADEQNHRSPELFDIDPNDGIRQTPDFRIKYWYISGCPGDTIGLKIGSYVRFKVITVSGDPVAIPLDGLYLTSGMDIQSVNISTPSDLNFTSYLLGYRE